MLDKHKTDRSTDDHDAASTAVGADEDALHLFRPTSSESDADAHAHDNSDDAPAGNDFDQDVENDMDKAYIADHAMPAKDCNDEGVISDPEEDSPDLFADDEAPAHGLPGYAGCSLRMFRNMC